MESTMLPEKKEKKILLNLLIEKTIAKLNGLSVCMATQIEIAIPPISSPIRDVIVPKKTKKAFFLYLSISLIITYLPLDF
jgi:hypothetical protein